MKRRIFISAMTAEFKSQRQIVANILQRRGQEPIWQDIFGTEAGDLRDVLRQKIDSCEGLIHIVGRGFGSEPPEADAEFGRVSYTQFEFLYACKQLKKTWVVIAEDACTRDRRIDLLDQPYGPTVSDTKDCQRERRQLQDAWRSRLQDTKQCHLWYLAKNDEELQLRVERLIGSGGLSSGFRRWQRALLALTLFIAVVVSSSIGYQVVVNIRQEQTKKFADDRQRQETRLNEQRAALKRDTERRNFAFSLGASVAMLGQSSADVGHSVFERSLRQLGVQDSEVGELYRTYILIEGDIKQGAIDYFTASKKQRELITTLRARLRVAIGDTYVSYIDLGYDTARLWLLIRHWKALDDAGDRLGTGRDYIMAFKKSVEQSSISGEIAAQVAAITPDAIESDVQREAVNNVVQMVIKQCDFEPFR